MNNKLKINQALLTARMQFPEIKKETTAFKFKYANLESIYDNIIPILYDNGVRVQHDTVYRSEETLLITRLIHVESGEEVTSEYPMSFQYLRDDWEANTKSDSKAIFNRNHLEAGKKTYCKRQMLYDMLALCPGDEDNDGHASSSRPQENVPSPSWRPNQNDQPSSRPQENGTEVKSEFISVKQIGMLKWKIKESGNPLKEQEICRKYNIGSLAQLPWRKMTEVLEYLTSIQNPQPAQADAFAESFEEVPF